MSLNDIKESIRYLRGLDLSKYPEQDIIKGLKSLKQVATFVTEFHTGNVIYRVRPNEPGETFRTVSELSYKPPKYNKTFQRASQPWQTMFYGSIIPQSNQDSEINAGRVIAMAEGSKLFRNNANDDGLEMVTFSMWRLQDTLSLSTILHPNIEKNITPFAKEKAEMLLTWLKQFPDVEEQNKEILSFYADEFSKLIEMGEPDYNYLHSAFFTDLALKVNKSIQGVCYPSGRVEGKGINVAIHPDFVDAHHMRMEAAMECVIAKRDKHYVCVNFRLALLGPGESELNFEEIDSWDQVMKNIELGFSR